MANLRSLFFKNIKHILVIFFICVEDIIILLRIDYVEFKANGVSSWMRKIEIKTVFIIIKYTISDIHFDDNSKSVKAKKERKINFI